MTVPRKSFIGLCNTNIKDCVSMLHQFYPNPIYTVITEDDARGHSFFSVPKGIIVFYSAQLFNKFFDYVKYTSHDVIVLGPAVVLEYLEPIKILDVGYAEKPYTYNYKVIGVSELKAALEVKTDCVFCSKPIDLLPTLLRNEPGTITTPILNFLYTIQSAEDRKEISDYIFSWLYSNETVEDLENVLIDVCRIPQVRARQEAFDKLKEFVNSSLGIGIRNALREAKSLGMSGTNVEVHSLSKKYGVTTYDLKYIIKSFSDVELSEEEL